MFLSIEKVSVVILTISRLATALPSAFLPTDIKERQLSQLPILYKDLKLVLSKNATFVQPTDSEAWRAQIERWSIYQGPNPSLAVNVASEKDIQLVIKKANQYKVPFLVKNRGHGSTSTLGRFSGGLQINVNTNAFQKITIDTANNIATIGGGVSNHDVIQALHSARRVSATGSCSCVGFLGATLGGGHGRQQGMYGLVADNLLSARVVLSNGSLVEASVNKNADLFWGLRGAGHNLGVVTEINYKIYEPANQGNMWWLAHFMFTAEQVEDVFTAMNTIRENQPAELSMFVQFMYFDPASSEPGLLVAINSATPFEEHEKWSSYLENVGPTWKNISTVPWNNVAEESYSGLSSALCTTMNIRRSQWPVGMTTQEPSDARITFELFKTLTTANPGLKGSTVLYEMYATRKFQEVDERSTAYPHRGANFIAMFTAIYEDSSLDNITETWGPKFREELWKTSSRPELEVYVNYAQGDENLTAVYGVESWRQQKLQELKKKYDPLNDFRFYEPIVKP